MSERVPTAARQMRADPRIAARRRLDHEPDRLDISGVGFRCMCDIGTNP
jgi:hypothetical protein